MTYRPEIDGDDGRDLHQQIKDMFDRFDLTPTGRIKHEPDMQYIIPSTNLRETKEILENVPKGLHMAMDFIDLESTTVALLVGHRGGKTHIIEQISMDQMYKIKDDSLVPEFIQISDENTKQNGRSAAYLKHDKTKKYGRRR